MIALQIWSDILGVYFQLGVDKEHVSCDWNTMGRTVEHVNMMSLYYQICIFIFWLLICNTTLILLIFSPDICICESTLLLEEAK